MQTIQIELFVVDRRPIPQNKGLHKLVFSIDSRCVRFVIDTDEYPFIPEVSGFDVDGKGYSASLIQDEGDIVFLASSK